MRSSILTDDPTPILGYTTSESRWRQQATQWLPSLAWIVPAALYVAIAIPIAWRNQYQMNPDGIIYWRKAQFLVSGHFLQSVSGYWSPGSHLVPGRNSRCISEVRRASRHPRGAYRLGFLLDGELLCVSVFDRPTAAAGEDDCRRGAGDGGGAAGRGLDGARPVAVHFSDGVPVLLDVAQTGEVDTAAWRVAGWTWISLQIVRAPFFCSPFSRDARLPALRAKTRGALAAIFIAGVWRTCRFRRAVGGFVIDPISPVHDLDGVPPTTISTSRPPAIY